MRPLTMVLAQKCEDADPESRCRCRCGGVHHGARRGWVGALPPEDTHRPRKAWIQLPLPFVRDVSGR